MAGRTERQPRFRRILAAVGLFVLLGTAHAVVPLLPGPQWAELPPETRAILAPLANDWGQLEAWRREKWVEIAQRYPKLTSTEQARVQERMRAWAALTPAQRKTARERYQTLQAATPAQREALKRLWNEYGALPEEDKRRFLEEAARKQAKTSKGSTNLSIVPAKRPPLPKIPLPPANTPSPEAGTGTAAEAASPPTDPSTSAPR